MPSRSSSRLQPSKKAREHIAEALEDYRSYQRFVQTLENQKWAVVTLFYSALHLVQAHAITRCGMTQEPVPSNHYERIIYVNRHLGRIERDYAKLEDISKAVRYDLWRSSPEEFARLHDEAFTRIRTYLAAQNIACDE